MHFDLYIVVIVRLLKNNKELGGTESFGRIHWIHRTTEHFAIFYGGYTRIMNHHRGAKSALSPGTLHLPSPQISRSLAW